MAELPQEIFFSTAVELNQRLIRKEFSAVELARAFDARLARHASVMVSLKKDAHDKARDVDRELKRGRTRGPLQGVPFAVTDLLSVARRPTTWGSPIFARQTFDENAAVVDKLGKAGAVLAAKLRALELGGAGLLAAAESAPFAAAVAGGMVPYAVGIESFGSMQATAAGHRLTLLKPTYGLVSRYGAMPLAWTLDRVAVAARSAEDCGHVLNAMAGGDERDAGTTGASFHFALQYERPVSAMRIGFSPMDAAFLGPVLELLRKAGATLSEATLPDFPYDATNRTILAVEAATTFADLTANGTVEELGDSAQRDGLRAGLEIRASDYLRAMRVRSLAQVALNRLVAPLDLLVTVTGGATSTASRAPGLADHRAAADLAGWPELTIPGPSKDHPGRSICLITKPQGENSLLQAAIALQAQSDWHQNPSPA